MEDLRWAVIGFGEVGSVLARHLAHVTGQHCAFDTNLMNRVSQLISGQHLTQCRCRENPGPLEAASKAVQLLLH